jgi:hypothetical protein
MYVHIGGEYSVSDKYIVGIFDFDGTTEESSETIGFLKKAEADGKIEIVSPDIPRAFIVTLDRVYITPISPVTLRRRMSQRSDGGHAKWLAAGSDNAGDG